MTNEENKTCCSAVKEENCTTKGEGCTMKEESCSMKDEKNVIHTAKVQMHEVMAIADVLDGEDAVTIWFEIPGACKDSVTIEVKDRVMKVRAESCLRKGGIPIVFHREFQLSDCIDVQGITASTQDGVLTLTLPKSEHAKVHRIKVS